MKVQFFNYKHLNNGFKYFQNMFLFFHEIYVKVHCIEYPLNIY